LGSARSEAVEANSHHRVGGEKVSRSCGGQCNFERLPSLVHESPGSFQNGKRRMPFIEIADNIEVKVGSANGQWNN
jgi:hypothetical protein